MKIDIDINTIYEELKVILQSPKMTEEVNEIIKVLNEKKNDKIFGKINDKTYILECKDIVRFYSYSQKVKAETLDKTYEIKMKLYEIEEKLHNTSFVRISKFAIVNVDQINNLELLFNGNISINLKNGQKESISRRYTKKVKEFIGMGGN